MGKRWRLANGEHGQAAFSVVVVIVVVALAAVLVNRVAWTASAINAKAGRIAKTAVPINEATDAVLNLDRTNQLAGSILETAKPLSGQLGEIVRLAQAVDRLAISINGSATDIDGTAKGINSNASGILGTARSIDRGVQQIIRNLNETLGIVGNVKGDSGNILAQAVQAHDSAACIDRSLPGGTNDNHCR